jgi:hypothetical protein
MAEADFVRKNIVRKQREILPTQMESGIPPFERGAKGM